MMRIVLAALSVASLAVACALLLLGAPAQRQESEPRGAGQPEGSAERPPLLAHDGRPHAIEPLRARELAVTVVDASTDAPVRNARVVAWAHVVEPSAAGKARAAATDAEGKTRLLVWSRGPIRVEVSAEGYVSDAWMEAADGETGTVVRLFPAFTLEGRVQGPDGSPAAGATVEAGARDGHDEGRVLVGVTADRNGAFRLLYRSAGPMTVRASLERGDEILEAIGVGTAGGEPIVLRLVARAAEKPGTLTVRVVDPGGRPVPQARVRLRDATGSEIEVRERAGVADFRPKKRIEAWVDVWDAATANGTPLPLGPATEGPIPATAHEVTVRLPEERRIDGVVLDPDGVGVPGVDVVATWSVSRILPYDAPLSTATGTGVGGAFRLGRLGSDECTLTAQVPPAFVPPTR